MSVDPYMALVEDVSDLPQIDLTHLACEDRLTVQTRQSIYEFVLAVLNMQNQPPLWMAQARGSGWLQTRVYALIGANTSYYEVSYGTEIAVDALTLNRLIQGFPIVLGDMHDGCAVMGPIEHVWLNASKRF